MLIVLVRRMMINKLKTDEKLAYWFEYTANLTDNQQAQYYQYFELINEYNQVMNLTGIDDLHGVYLKHFYDSLTITGLIDDNVKTIADIGSGAGFPGIVLAIYYPQIKFSLIEPLTKRCKFLEVVVSKLDLKNVVIVNERAEDVKDKYDIVTSRAVSRLNILLELSIPLVKVGGYFIPLKGAQAETEIKEAQHALKELSASVEEVQQIILPFEESKRANIKIKKTKATNKKYPRNYGQIKKKPL